MLKEVKVKTFHNSMEIFVEEDKIVLKKYEPACIFCGEAEDVVEYEGKMVCKDCLENIKKEI